MRETRATEVGPTRSPLEGGVTRVALVHQKNLRCAGKRVNQQGGDCVGPRGGGRRLRPLPKICGVRHGSHPSSPGVMCMHSSAEATALRKCGGVNKVVHSTGGYRGPLCPPLSPVLGRGERRASASRNLVLAGSTGVGFGMRMVGYNRSWDMFNSRGFVWDGSVGAHILSDTVQHNPLVLYERWVMQSPAASPVAMGRVLGG